MKNAGYKGKKKMWIIVTIISLCFLVVVCAIIPPSLGKTKPFLDKDKNILDGSISEKTFVDVNGTSLGMFIMAKDRNKPVLLFLSGGPSIPSYLLEKDLPSGLENEFVVCYLAYRGTSLSYNPNTAIESMIIDQYIDDAVEITNYLRNRFEQEKIYLIGHSFGSYVGINTVYGHPELYHTYIAMGQIANQNESEILAYNYMYEQYRSQGNAKMIKWFEENPIDKSENLTKYFTSSNLRDTAMHDLGVGTTHKMRSIISGIFFPSLRNIDYTPIERINIWRGNEFVKTTPIKTSFFFFNAFDKIPKIDIPIFFLAGIYDYTVCYSLQKEYFEHIQAPLKAFYTFHNSAHSPLFEEAEKAMEILSQDVLTGRKTLAD
jgi:pimeloyl-ACP methyl ester carboxylesterase